MSTFVRMPEVVRLLQMEVVLYEMRPTLRNIRDNPVDGYFCSFLKVHSMEVVMGFEKLPIGIWPLLFSCCGLLMILSTALILHHYDNPARVLRIARASFPKGFTKNQLCQKFATRNRTAINNMLDEWISQNHVVKASDFYYEFTD